MSSKFSKAIEKLDALDLIHSTQAIKDSMLAAESSHLLKHSPHAGSHAIANNRGWYGGDGGDDDDGDGGDAKGVLGNTLASITNAHADGGSADARTRGLSPSQPSSSTRAHKRKAAKSTGRSVQQRYQERSTHRDRDRSRERAREARGRVEKGKRVLTFTVGQPKPITGMHGAYAYMLICMCYMYAHACLQ